MEEMRALRLEGREMEERGEEEGDGGSGRREMDEGEEEGDGERGKEEDRVRWGEEGGEEIKK